MLKEKIRLWWHLPELTMTHNYSNTLFCIPTFTVFVSKRKLFEQYKREATLISGKPQLFNDVIMLGMQKRVLL